MVNQLAELLTVAQEKPEENYAEELEKIINELCNYTEYHFRLEEELMKEHNYDKLQEHKEIHDDFRLKVFKFRKDLALLGPCELIEGVLGSLKKWLIQHILFVDQDMAKLFKDQNL